MKSVFLIELKEIKNLFYFQENRFFILDNNNFRLRIF